MSGGGAEREGDRIWSRLQALSCQHRARCGAQTHELWDHDLGQSQTLNQLSHPGAPSKTHSLNCFWRTLGKYKRQQRWVQWFFSILYKAYVWKSEAKVMHECSKRMCRCLYRRKLMVSIYILKLGPVQLSHHSQFKDISFKMCTYFPQTPIYLSTAGR